MGTIFSVTDILFTPGFEALFGGLTLSFQTTHLQSRTSFKRLESMGSLCLLSILLSLFITVLFFIRQSRSSANRFQWENDMLITPAVPFRFLDLPVELRFSIYSLLLFTEEPLRWIGPKYHPDYRNGSLLAGAVKVKNRLGATATRNGLRVTTATAILFTCKAIYLEAINLFYQNNVFEIPPTNFNTQPILRRQPLPHLVRRLRVQYRGVYEPWRVLPKDYTNIVDAIISSCLLDVVDRCPNFTSLTIGGIPDPGEVNNAWIVEESGWYDI